MTTSASAGTSRHARAASNRRGRSQATGSWTSSARWPAARSAVTSPSMRSSAPPREKGTWAPQTKTSMDERVSYASALDHLEHSPAPYSRRVSRPRQRPTNLLPRLLARGSGHLVLPRASRQPRTQGTEGEVQGLRPGLPVVLGPAAVPADGLLAGLRQVPPRRHPQLRLLPLLAAGGVGPVRDPSGRGPAVGARQRRAGERGLCPRHDAAPRAA